MSSPGKLVLCVIDAMAPAMLERAVAEGVAPVLAALKTVRDPEIPMDLVELGLIYELIVKKGGTVFVEMTLTTPACPVAASMPGEVEAAIRTVPGVSDVRVKLVWTPPWGPERMSEEARLELGML